MVPAAPLLRLSYKGVVLRIQGKAGKYLLKLLLCHNSSSTDLVLSVSKK